MRISNTAVAVAAIAFALVAVLFLVEDTFVDYQVTGVHWLYP